MSATEAQMIHRGQVAKGLHVEFWMPKDAKGFVSMTVEWDPYMPKKLNKKMYRRYEQERHQFLLKAQEKLGTPVICLDI